MTTTPGEPVEDPQLAPAGDAGIGDPPRVGAESEPDPEETVGPGVND
jgi:hypothetical protein